MHNCDNRSAAFVLLRSTLHDGLPVVFDFRNAQANWKQSWFLEICVPSLYSLPTVIFVKGSLQLPALFENEFPPLSMMENEKDANITVVQFVRRHLDQPATCEPREETDADIVPTLIVPHGLLLVTASLIACVLYAIFSPYCRE